MVRPSTENTANSETVLETRKRDERQGGGSDRRTNGQKWKNNE